MHHGFGGPPGFGGPDGPPWHGGHGGRRGGWFMQPPMWGFLQPCLLLLLAERPQHGYSLLEELNRRNLLDSGVDVGNLYRTLHRMQAAGLVTSVLDEAGAGPNKRVYQVTESGKELLKGWAGALEQRTRAITNFLDEFHRVFGADAGNGPPVSNDEDDLR